MSNNEGKNDNKRNRNTRGSVLLHTFGLADDSAVDAAGAGSEEAVAADVVLASSSVLFFCCCCCCSFDAISIFFIFECLINVFFLRMLELNWQTVGVLSYICAVNCQSIRA